MDNESSPGFVQSFFIQSKQNNTEIENQNRGFMYHIYRVSQEERSIFWEVIVSVILIKNVYMNMYPIPNGFRD